MTEEENEEGRAKALFYYRILALVLGVLGGGMLICGIIAASNVDDDIFGTPYFVGGFIVGIMALISAILTILIIVKSPKSDSNLQKKELACVIRGQFTLSFFMIPGCFISTVICGIGGFPFENERSSLNQTLAVVIMVGNVLGFLVTISSMCILCAYGSYFEVVVTSGQQRAVNITTNQGVGLYGSTTTTANTNVFQSDFGGVHMNMSGMNMGGVGMAAGGNSSRVNELERQNQLLKEQLELQRQLNEQQQQQQQQYGGGFTQPPPPPMYNIDPAYCPTAPPPCYDDVKH